jgi:predicted phage-related endonuclease
MRWIDCKQGSQEWLDAHLGIPSASQFDRIISPKKLEASAQQRKYLCELVAERVTGLPSSDSGGSLWMERGSALESEAAAYYELTTGREARLCGFALTDDGRVGCSPDRLVGEDGLLEIKCPSAPIHIGYLIFGLDDAYRLQLQGQLYVTGRAWVDFLSHCPGLPPVQERMQRDPEVLDALAREVVKFCNAVDYAQDKLAKLAGATTEAA